MKSADQNIIPFINLHIRLSDTALNKNRDTVAMSIYTNCNQSPERTARRTNSSSTYMCTYMSLFCTTFHNIVKGQKYKTDKIRKYIVFDAYMKKYIILAVEYATMTNI